MKTRTHMYRCHRKVSNFEFCCIKLLPWFPFDGPKPVLFPIQETNLKTQKLKLLFCYSEFFRIKLMSLFIIPFNSLFCLFCLRKSEKKGILMAWLLKHGHLILYHSNNTFENNTHCYNCSVAMPQHVPLSLPIPLNVKCLFSLHSNICKQKPAF